MAAQRADEEVRCLVVALERPRARLHQRLLGDRLILVTRRDEDVLGVGWESGRAYLGTDAWRHRTDSVSTFWYRPEPGQLRVVVPMASGQILLLAEETPVGILGEIAYLADPFDDLVARSRVAGLRVDCER